MTDPLYDRYLTLLQAARDQMSNFLVERKTSTLHSVSAACRRAEAAYDAYMKAKGELHA